MSKNKVNLKERVNDGEMDLSMSGLDDIPVKEIAQYRKIYALDLSNNNLKLLPKTFPTLTHITKLDLSKNELSELPDNFGDLVKLRYLDLYHNKLQHLPLSFSKLVDLKFLDLKDNPLVPTVSRIAGPCLDAKECQTCARNVVKFFVQLQEQVDSELKMRQQQRQKEADANQIKKQNEKKSKKKMKNKEKPETPTKSVVQSEKIISKETKKSSKNIKKSNNSSIFYKLFKLLFVFMLFVIPILFVLTSINVKCTNIVREYTTDVYTRTIFILPPNFKQYAIIIGDYIANLHDKTGNYTNHMINFLQTNEDCQYFYSVINNFLYRVIGNLKQIYHNFVQ